MDNQTNWKAKTMLTGAIIGSLSGLLAAYILIQRAEQNEERPSLTPGEGVKLGLGLLGMLRLVSDFSESKK